jgi:alkanesulfonate monooxygenase SsuD/methylene tetrahydromethanopterin reductase-like flavin-dependent oxidoreductase (luciferase family)
VPTAQAFYRNLKARAAAHGRNPDELLILPGLNITLGSTEAEAKARRAEVVGRVPLDAEGLRTLATQLGVPAELLVLDKSLPWDFFESPQWRPRSVGHANAVLAVARPDDLTVRQILERRANVQNAIVGTPEQAADEIEVWFTSRAADGFNINFDVFPSGLEQIADQLVPELQRRGIFRTEYESATLRGHYGLPELDTDASSAAAATA